jgi:chromosome segregation ATPase
MKRKEDPDVMSAFQRLTSAAEGFVNRAPRVKRIQAERSSLLAAITDAQLVLSVHRLPKEQESKSVSSSKSTSLLEKQIQRSKATLNELERRLRPLRVELEELHSRAQNAKGLLDRVLATPDLGLG